MFAIIDVNGKQYQIQEGRYVDVDYMPHEPNETITLENILMISAADGHATPLIGLPVIEGAKVTAKILSHHRGPKALVYKMRCKKGYRRKNGHRQTYTRLQIERVDYPGKKQTA